jgi:lipoprotein-anchoring transpeptidase ErfK/SrfK
MRPDDQRPMAGSRHRRWLVATALLGAVAAAAATWVVWETVQWGAQLEAQQAMLPGTLVESIEVSELALDDAIAAVEPSLDERLDRTVTMVHGERRWTTSPRDLGAETDLEDVLRTAQDASSLQRTDLARMRWFGDRVDVDLEVTMTVPADRVDAFVARLGRTIDRVPVEAALRLVGHEPELVEGAVGARLERDEATARLWEALDADGDRTVELPVTELRPTITTELAASALPEVRTAVASALDHPVRIVAGERSWTVTARELDAVPDLEPAIAALTDLGTVRAVASTEDEPALRAEALEVPLRLTDDEPVAALVERIAAEIEVPVRDARLDLDGGWVVLVPERSGISVDRGSTTEAVRAGVLSGAEEIEVQTLRITPDVTTAAYRQVLLVRQGDRRVYLYEGGQVVRDWPAAIGTSDHPTPTGRFRVGAKRYEPTWTNPSPHDWGAGMPAFVGPGPDNPLGPRAINWNRPSGRDSLIRFHGTPDESSIGQAATHGCIRMFNRDVIELYDRIDKGATIVSVP